MIIGSWSDCIALRTNQLPSRKIIQNLETVMALLLNANAARLLISACHLQSTNLVLLHLFPMNLLADPHYWMLSGYCVECVCAVLTQITNISTTKESETILGRPNNLFY